MLLSFITGSQETLSPSRHAPPVQPAHSHHLGYKLVGDNIDKGVKARYMRIEGRHNHSFHYFHSFAVQSRIDFSHLPDQHPDTCFNSPYQLALSMLPSADDDRSLRDLFVTHVSRILCTHMPFFKFAFEDVVEWHIQHEYYDQMSTKSQVVSRLCYKQEIILFEGGLIFVLTKVPLGVLLKNENKADDMVEIMAHLHQYVPAVEYKSTVFIPSTGETVEVQNATMCKVLLGGDQLTVARARGAQKAKLNSTSPLTRLSGLIPCAEDWHTKLNLLGVCFYLWCYTHVHKMVKSSE